MTAIAYSYDQDEIAIDSRVTADGIINSNAYDKTVIHGDSLYFLTGVIADFERFVQGHNSNKIEKSLECSAYMVKEQKVYLVTVEEGIYKTMELKYSDTMGSGYKFALSALDFGKSAKQAVEYAATRDTSTGGKVRVFSVSDNKWQS